MRICFYRSPYAKDWHVAVQAEDLENIDAVVASYVSRVASSTLSMEVCSALTIFYMSGRPHGLR